MYHQLGMFDEANTSLELGLHLCHEIGDHAGEAFILANLGAVQRDLDHLTDAEHFLAQSLTIARSLHDQTVIAYCLSYLGSIVLQQGRPSEAREYAEAALTLRRQIGLELWATADLATLAAVHLAQDETERAREFARDVLKTLDAHRDEEPEYPHHDCFVCYRVLTAVKSSEEAHAALLAAHDLLMSRAARILDPELHRSFLLSVPLNRAILTEAEAVLGTSPRP